MAIKIKGNTLITDDNFWNYDFEPASDSQDIGANDNPWRDIYMSGDIRSDNEFDFLRRSNGAAQSIKVKSVYAGTTYADGNPPEGAIDVLNGYQVQGTTVIDSSRNIENIGTIDADGLISGGEIKISPNSGDSKLRIEAAAGNRAYTRLHSGGYYFDIGHVGDDNAPSSGPPWSNYKLLEFTPGPGTYNVNGQSGNFSDRAIKFDMLGTVHLHGLHVMNSGPGGEGDIEVEGNIKLDGKLQNQNGVGLSIADTADPSWTEGWEIDHYGALKGHMVKAQILEVGGGFGGTDTLQKNMGDDCSYLKGTIVVCNDPNGNYAGYICACNRKPGSSTQWTYQFIGDMVK
tara:strand:+ start:1921 stop:2952 length:1032 start_codon:yes stop_codon:yes gene_type:complete